MTVPEAVKKRDEFKKCLTDSFLEAKDDKFLDTVERWEVTFKKEDSPNHIFQKNGSPITITKEQGGLHFFEFVMHKIGDEQW